MRLQAFHGTNIVKGEGDLNAFIVSAGLPVLNALIFSSLTIKFTGEDDRVLTPPHETGLAFIKASKTQDRPGVVKGQVKCFRNFIIANGKDIGIRTVIHKAAAIFRVGAVCHREPGPKGVSV